VYIICCKPYTHKFQWLQGVQCIIGFILLAIGFCLLGPNPWLTEYIPTRCVDLKLCCIDKKLIGSDSTNISHCINIIYYNFIAITWFLFFKNISQVAWSYYISSSVPGTVIALVLIGIGASGVQNPSYTLICRMAR